MAVPGLAPCLALLLAGLIGGARSHDRSDGGNFERASVRRLLQEPEAVPRIANGEDAPCGRFPYMVSLNDRHDVHKCGGVLVHPKWVLTAAHCVDPQSPDSIGAIPVIVIGACHLHKKENENGEVEFMQPTKTVIHEKWTGRVAEGHDIALLKVNKASRHAPVGLPPAIHEISEVQTLLALGWGVDEGGGLPQDLRQADVDLVRRNVCNAEGVWNGLVQDSMMCAFSLGGQDVCRGDSGGPLLQPFAPNGNISDGRATLDVLVGITSFGGNEMCGSSEKPSIFVRVSAYSDWIGATIKMRSAPSDQAPPSAPSNQSAPELTPDESPPPASPPTSEPLSALTPPEVPEVLTGEVSKKQKKQLTKELEAALYVVEAGGDPASVEAAIAKGADVNAWIDDLGFTPLMFAASLGHLELLGILLRAGARVDARDRFGQTALVIASADGKADAVGALIEAGADVHAATDDGSTSLSLASSGLRTPIVEALLAEGADPNKVRAGGFTPLHYVSSQTGPESAYLAQVLIDAGADLEGQTKNGRTPLYEAAFYGNLGVVRTLLSAGSDPGVADSKGRKPFDVVCKCKRIGQMKNGVCSNKACKRQGTTRKIKRLLREDQ